MSLSYPQILELSKAIEALPEFLRNPDTQIALLNHGFLTNFIAIDHNQKAYKYYDKEWSLLYSQPKTYD